MCQFVSWINDGGTNYFLTNDDLRGKKFNEYKKYNCRWCDDIIGHGAIRYFYPELEGIGVDKECTDFRDPSNFPAEIVEAIKGMKMTGLFLCLEALSAPALTVFYAARNHAWTTCDIKQVEALDECILCKGIAWCEWTLDAPAGANDYTVKSNRAERKYIETKNQLTDEYKKRRKEIFWEIFSNPENRLKAWR